MIWKPAAMKRARELAAELNRPNWDSYGAKPIDAASLERFGVLLDSLPNESRERLTVWPVNDGNFSIDADLERLMIDHEGAFAEVDGKQYEGPLAGMPREMLGRFFELNGPENPESSK